VWGKNFLKRSRYGGADSELRKTWGRNYGGGERREKDER